MSVNFEESCIRHYEDAEILKKNNRLPNAAQLYGFCAECGVKHIIIAKKYVGSISPKEKKHIHELKGPVLQLLSGRATGLYTKLEKVFDDFADWHTSHRYEENQTNDDKQIIEKWQLAAEDIKKTIELINIGGIL